MVAVSPISLCATIFVLSSTYAFVTRLHSRHVYRTNEWRGNDAATSQSSHSSSNRFFSAVSCRVRVASPSENDRSRFFMLVIRPKSIRWLPAAGERLHAPTMASSNVFALSIRFWSLAAKPRIWPISDMLALDATVLRSTRRWILRAVSASTLEITHCRLDVFSICACWDSSNLDVRTPWPCPCSQIGINCVLKARAASS